MHWPLFYSEMKASNTFCQIFDRNVIVVNLHLIIIIKIILEDVCSCADIQCMSYVLDQGISIISQGCCDAHVFYLLNRILCVLRCVMCTSLK